MSLHGSGPVCEIHKNYMYMYVPRKFGAIQYMHTMYVVKSRTIYNPEAMNSPGLNLEQSPTVEVQDVF